VVALVASDLVSAGWGYNPTLAAQDFFPSTKVVEALVADEGQYRVTALRQDLIPDAHIFFGWSDVRGLDFMTRWYQAYMTLAGRMPWLSYGTIVASAESPLLAVMNIKYVISADLAGFQPAEAYTSVRALGSIYVGERAHVQPRAFMVYQAVTASSEVEAIALLKADPAAVYTRTILLMQEGQSAPVLVGAGDVEAQVETLAAEAQNSAWRVQTAAPGFLFVSDAYFPGWRAWVDGQAAEIYQANLAFRALYVPAGVHEVVMRYVPASVRWGLVISGVGVVVTLGMIGATSVLWRAHAKKQTR
jgi:hypothetical protein